MLNDVSDKDIKEAERLHKLATWGPPLKAQDNGVFLQADGWRQLLATFSTECPNWRNDASAFAAIHNVAPLLFAAWHEAKAMRSVVSKAMQALGEAEAILGGEYGDHYGVLCQQMIELRNALAQGGGNG